MIKAVILDIDGTLLNSEHVISERTKQKLIEVQKKGIKVMLASGRPTPGLFRFARELELEKYEGFLISFNGGTITDCQSKKEIYKQPIKKELAKELLDWIEKFDLITVIFKDQNLCVKNVYNCFIDEVYDKPFNVLEYEARGNDLNLMEVKNLSEFLDFDPTKILIAGTPSMLKEKAKQLSDPFKGRLTSTFTTKFFFEFMDLGIDKASALKIALPQYGIKKEEIIAFGDGQNDKSMIEYAGIGIAMGNAVQELKDIADYVTTSKDEDGIALALEKYGL